MQCDNPFLSGHGASPTVAQRICLAAALLMCRCGALRPSCTCPLRPAPRREPGRGTTHTLIFPFSLLSGRIDSRHAVILLIQDGAASEHGADGDAEMRSGPTDCTATRTCFPAILRRLQNPIESQYVPLLATLLRPARKLQCVSSLSSEPYPCPSRLG